MSTNADNFDILRDLPANAEEKMNEGLSLETPFQGLNELVALRFDLVFHIEDLLALAALAPFEIPCFFLQRLLLFNALGKAGTALGVPESGFGVLQRLFGGKDLIIGPALQLFPFLLEVLVVRV